MISFDVLTLFPNMFQGFLSESIIKRSIEKGLLNVNLTDYRLYSADKHNTVDDYAYSGGAGMLISVEPIHRALMDIKNLDNAHKILLTPSGKKLTQAKVEELSKYEHIVLICGHYEGIDARVEEYVDEEISIGDYVLMGGEVASMVLIESISRLVDGVITKDSIVDESFTSKLLEYPQYTHPYEYDGKVVPDVLLSGNHAKINEWKRYKSLEKTYLVRPDLLKEAALSLKDYQMLWEIKKNHEKNN